MITHHSYFVLQYNIYIPEIENFFAVSFTDVILGFQQQFHTVFEGQSEEVCVVILSGVANQTLSLQMLSIFARSASGLSLHYPVINY